MPMYLGNDRVKGMYLGSDVYDGFYLGNDSSTYDYGVDNFASIYGDPDASIWNIDSGFTSKGTDANSVYFAMTGGGGASLTSTAFTTRAGGKYEYTVKRNSGGTAPDLNDFLVVFTEDGVNNNPSLQTLSLGGTATYSITTPSSVSLKITVFSFSVAAFSRLWIDYAYIKEVK